MVIMTKPNHCLFRAEEYEDEEHDVLHKSVAGDTVEASSSASPMHITVQFPRPTNYSWLFKQNNTTTSNATTPLAMVTINLVSLFICIYNIHLP